MQKQPSEKQVAARANAKILKEARREARKEEKKEKRAREEGPEEPAELTAKGARVDWEPFALTDVILPLAGLAGGCTPITTFPVSRAL